MSNLDNRGDGTSPGTQNLVQISLYSNINRSKEVSRFTIRSCLNKIPTLNSIISEKDNSKTFNYFLNEILLNAISISQE